MPEIKRPPVIGISGKERFYHSVAAMASLLQTAGAKVVFLDHTDPAKAEEHLKKVDAVVVMGSVYDVDPKKYNAPTTHPKTKITPENDPDETKDVLLRNEYEERLIKDAIKEKIPLLGVCRGMQLLNVCLGGTLHQHIPDLLGGSEDHDWKNKGVGPYVPVQYVAIRPGTQLSVISGIPRLSTPKYAENLPPDWIPENSFHHQAVAKVGKGLTINAISEDNIIEGVESNPNGPYKDQFILGVQFHPEFSASKMGLRIASEMVNQATKRATEHPCAEYLTEGPPLREPPHVKNWQQLVSRIAHRSSGIGSGGVSA